MAFEFTMKPNMTSDDLLPLKPYFAPHHLAKYSYEIFYEKQRTVTEEIRHKTYANLAISVIHEYNKTHKDKIIVR